VIQMLVPDLPGCRSRSWAPSARCRHTAARIRTRSSTATSLG
jgi:hypothetical protein